MEHGRTAPRPRREAGRASVLGARAAVSSSSPVVSFAGARVLADGGNAVDATLAMAAVAWMALPGQCGVGGDAFALVREPDGRVWAICGSGFGPDGGEPDFYRSLGHSALPLSGALAVTVPGALAAVRTLHAHGATRALDELWAPAIDLAEHGIACTAKTRADIALHADSLRADPDAAEVFLPGGDLPRVGQVLRQSALGAFLRRTAAGTEGFYDGEFADRALAALVGAGAPFSGEEWAAGADAPAVAALSTSYAGLRVHQTPMPSAGWMVLQQAVICDGVLAGRERLDAESVHWLASAARRAFRDRFEAGGSDSTGWAESLRPERVARAREEIAGGLVAAGPARLDGDTTSTVVVDEEGRTVSFIHSLAFTFGAHLSVPGTGVLLNNRLGRGAYLLDGHPNEVRPRRRPLHTLNAWIADDATGLRHVGNCPGGDGQVQWNMQVLSHLVDHGTDPQEAVSLPRFTVFPGSDADVISEPEELRCEEGLAADTLAGLRSRGHTVREIPVQHGGPGGSALAISVDHEHGVLRAGADPRMEGVALAL
ncbi:gamma-glutamyltransferase family protein [Nocardioides sp. zg-DK7169]|uniref:gamma-glutamyltransferase family protein n=1 Tax=Nocardioides sp. zg-DK7169 TaxID=2736600 RepID=UPI0015575C41|nr:gamma-glutamyltransferase [Nocardioides sp. zg-DK7169]NPC96842.1 gamma-glutamyltransferase [Nocardioides sp. zg-DK7169]